MVSDLTKQCKSIGAHARHHYWNKISRAGQLAERDHPVWQLPTIGAMHSRRLSLHLLRRLVQLSPCQTDIGEVVDWIKGKFVVSTKSDLALLYNCNKMVNAFSTTKWVSGSGGTIISRSVTSCAGITAYLVLLAQTRVGFLSGGRGKSFRQLPAQEQTAQKEEAYARATVLLPEHNKFALSWTCWTCVGW